MLSVEHEKPGPWEGFAGATFSSEALSLKLKKKKDSWTRKLYKG